MCRMACRLVLPDGVPYPAYNTANTCETVTEYTGWPKKTSLLREGVAEADETRQKVSKKRSVRGLYVSILRVLLTPYRQCKQPSNPLGPNWDYIFRHRV